MKNWKKYLTYGLQALLACLAALFLLLVVTEYRPDAVQPLEISGDAHGHKLKAGDDLSILTWNIGYGALGKETDFILDGGGKAPAADRELVEKYLQGIAGTLREESDVSIRLLQEVDFHSFRSFWIDERKYFPLRSSCSALNYQSLFVPVPWPPFCRVSSGLYTTAEYEMESAQRISLPCPFAWPMRAVNLKRCMLVSYFPVEGSDKKLAVVNLHLEAYDDGDGKAAQMQQFRDFLSSEFKKGNYVIAGGDFNQLFPASDTVYPNKHPDLWNPPYLAAEDFSEGQVCAFDLNVPSCRLLNQPYDPTDTENTQYYVIDGFILSPNVQFNSITTLDKGFEYSDHNPVKLSVTLLPEN